MFQISRVNKQASRLNQFSCSNFLTKIPLVSFSLVSNSKGQEQPTPLKSTRAPGIKLTVPQHPPPLTCNGPRGEMRHRDFCDRHPTATRNARWLLTCLADVVFFLVNHPGRWAPVWVLVSLLAGSGWALGVSSVLGLLAFVSQDTSPMPFQLQTDFEMSSLLKQVQKQVCCL